MLVWADDRWWARQPDGSWALWDERENQWVPTSDTPPPGGTVASQHPRRRPYEPVASLAKWVMGLLAVAGAVSLLAVIADVGQLQLAGRLPDAATQPPHLLDEVTANNERQALMDGLQGILLLGTAPLFLAWFHRAYSNLLHLGIGRLRYSTGWAVGGWFVPVLGYWRPKELANDLWRANDPKQPITASLTWTKAPVDPSLLVWWISFVAAWLLGWNGFFQIGLWFWLGEPTLDSLKILLADAAMAMAAAAAIVVVQRITARQEARREALPFLGYEMYWEYPTQAH